MLWEEIRKIHEFLPEKSDGWHRHDFGGGWVEDSASVSDEAFVFGTAIVAGRASAGNKAVICPRARVTGNAKVLGAQVSGEVLDHAHVSGRARVERGGVVSGRARVDGYALVAGKVSISPIIIHSSRHPIGWAGSRMIFGGCIVNSLEWWQENVRRVAEEQGYSPEEQDEYAAHVEHIISWLKIKKIIQ